jgi:hypothetical protein
MTGPLFVADTYGDLAHQVGGGVTSSGGLGPESDSADKVQNQLTSILEIHPLVKEGSS